MIAAPLGMSTISLFIILIQHLRGTDEGDAPGVRQALLNPDKPLSYYDL